MGFKPDGSADEKVTKDDAVGESIEGHTPLSPRSHAQHGNALLRGSASTILVEAEP